MLKLSRASVYKVICNITLKRATPAAQTAMYCECCQRGGLRVQYDGEQREVFVVKEIRSSF